MAAFSKRRRTVSHSLVIGALFGLAQICAFANGSVTLAWIPSSDSSVVGYNLYYGGTSGNYTNTIRAANTTNTVISGLTDGATYYFAATAYDNSGVESPFSNEASYAVPLAITNSPVVNNPPTLNTLGNLTLNANAGLQTVNLSGIGSGAATEDQTLSMNVASSNPALMPTPTITYASPNANGALNFTPASNASGTATITVTVNDGQAQNNTITRTFTVTVNAVNNPPTLNTLGSLTLGANAGLQTVSLSGIGSGAATENQTLSVAAVSSNPALIPTPTITYSNPGATGTLKFTPASNASGTAMITVTVNDGQAQNNTITRTFTVTVNAVNTAPNLNPISDFYVTKNAAAQTVTLTGITPGATITTSSSTASTAKITQTKKPVIKITAVSGNTKLLAKPTIRYSSPGSAGTLTFKPVKNATGTTTITVTVNDGAKTIQKSFKVTVLATTTLPMPATLSPAVHASGQFALNIAGTSGVKYIVQASTDMVNWMPVQTNTAPFIYTDTTAGQFNQRFYRSVSAP